MATELANVVRRKSLSEIISFVRVLDKLTTKKEVASYMLMTFNSMLKAKFSSFVESDDGSLKVICQTGENSHIKNIFNNSMCTEIFNWVMKQKQIASLRLTDNEQFIFMPVLDESEGKSLQHGMLVFHLRASDFEFNKELNMTLNILGRFVALSMTKFLRSYDSEKYSRLQEQIKAELKLTAKLQRSMSGDESSKKILFSILEDEGAGFNGNVWWISELGDDISLVFIAQVLCKGSPSAMLSGYLLGEMNSLKNRAEISLKPREVMKYLNLQLNPVFKSTGITVNAWYGVFNVEAKKVRFANANHPDPFVVGPEQQVFKLSMNNNEKANLLGVNKETTFAEASSNISSGSKLVICTKDLLEHAAKIGEKYDPTWLPQVLETIGMLSVNEMCKSLESILSENTLGTAKMAPRLALLLEMPS